MASDRRHRVLTIARHEYRAAARSRILVVLLAILVIATAGSVIVAAAEYASRLADYQAYHAAAVAGGVTQIAPSPLAPLSLLRGAFEYIEIIGAVIAITLGYLTVSRERVNRTLPLLMSRPVTSGELAAGSLLGAVGVIVTLVVATMAVAVLSVGLVGHDWINVGQAGKLMLAFGVAVVYMATFYCLGAFTTASTKVATNGLMVALGIWLFVVLVLPQIGDTLDADNQIPGGLFAALGLGHDGEVQILTHFTAYETVRTSIEAASFAKHFERFAFAMTDVKERFRSLSLPDLFFQVRASIVWILIYATALPIALNHSFRNQPSIPQGET
ncbi:MAG: ABC transporter permease [Acidimicrobiia bacterium]|nr:ABC transporter permease [Acidimicrobiia bacterium]